jgi:preprotein translocase subunit SecG
MLDALIMVLLLGTSTFLILLVLVQRGRGGGLAGAFGGLGGQGAFGTKAGDLFTRITIFTAAFWIILCAFSVKYFSEGSRTVIAPTLGKNVPALPSTGGTGPSTAPGTKSGTAPASSAPASSAPATSAPPASGAPAGSGAAPADKAK